MMLCPSLAVRYKYPPRNPDGLVWAQLYSTELSNHSSYLNHSETIQSSIHDNTYVPEQRGNLTSTGGSVVTPGPSKYQSPPSTYQLPVLLVT